MLCYNLFCFIFVTYFLRTTFLPTTFSYHRIIQSYLHPSNHTHTSISNQSNQSPIPLHAPPIPAAPNAAPKSSISVKSHSGVVVFKSFCFVSATVFLFNLVFACIAEICVAISVANVTFALLLAVALPKFTNFDEFSVAVSL